MKNELAAAKGLPAWLDGRTVAIVGTVLTVGVGLGAMVIASSSATRAHVDTRIGDVNLRIDDVNTRIDDVNTRIDGLDRGLSARIDRLDRRLSARIDGLDRRLSAVQVGVAEIRVRLGLPNTVGREGRKTGTATPPDATLEPPG